MKTKYLVSSNQLSRRGFLGIGAAFCISLPISSLADSALKRVAKPVRIGLISDLHNDIIHDARYRLEQFVAYTQQSRVDGILQLGDFAYPAAKNKEVIDVFNRAHPTRLHVIGNHDTDAGHSKEQCLSIWGMPDRYYTQSISGITFIVLDGNDKGSSTHKGGYPAYINSLQSTWLKTTLQAVNEPVIIVSHQPLMGPLAVDNAAEIQGILAGASDKVLLAINGHTHVDSLLFKEAIPYLTINSASYFWVGDKFMHESYPKAVHQSHEWISRTCPYQDPLFTVMTVNSANRTIQIESRPSQWVGKSPAELGFSNEYQPLKVDQEITPDIRAHNIRG